MTRQITVDGPTIERADGSIVCVGYCEDSEGRVVSRFAVPSGEYEVADAVDSVHYVESMDKLADHPADPKYRTDI